MKHFLFLLPLIGSCAFADLRYFEIRDMEIKEEGKNSLAAKQKALIKTARSAFKKILDKDKSAIVSSISDRQIQNCIYDYSIDQEKFSDSVYIGRISYRFSKKKVASLLSPLGIKIELEEEPNNFIKLAIYMQDFMVNIKKLRELKIIVERFSSEKMIFRIEKNRVDQFRQLNVKYAQLACPQ